MKISVVRDRDDKVFTNDMSTDFEGIYEIHFCTSYTQVCIQEITGDGERVSTDIICPPFGSKPNWIDMIAVQNDETGHFIKTDED